MSHNPERQSRFENFKKWWFLEASKLIIQWYEAPSLPPHITRYRSDMTKEEKAAAYKNQSLLSLIRQFVELGWVIQDKTGIMIVTDIGKAQLDSIANIFKQKMKSQNPEAPKQETELEQKAED